METIDRNLLTFLLNSLWQVPMAALVTAGVCRLMRNSAARHRHAVCVAGLATAALLPIASALRPVAETPTIAVPERLENAAAAVAAAAPNSAPAAPARRNVPVPHGTASIVLWAFAGALALRLGRLTLAGVRTIGICARARHGSTPEALWERSKAAFGLRRVSLRWSAGIKSPVTAGRMVILPESMEGAPDDVLIASIGHEMAHIARHDFACNLAYELGALGIWFQPATWWLRREIDRTREMACDELVTSRLVARRAYAQTIVNIAAAMTGLQRPGYMLGVFDGDNLEERIRRLAHPRTANGKRSWMLLAAGIASLGACVVIASGLAISARAQTPAQQEMRTAADAYNSADYAGAAQHFERAVALEPDDIKARLFLAGTYVREDMPPLLEKAREQYLEVLKRDPKNKVAIFGVMSVNGPARAKQSRELMLTAIQSDPKSKEAYYSMGFLDWTIAFSPIKDANGGMGEHMYDRIADPAARARLRGEMLPYIEEGYRMLQIALSLDQAWPDPMAYLNLLSRLNAALVDTPAEWTKLIAQADDWVTKALAAKRNRPILSKITQNHIDIDGPPPIAIPTLVPPPPPPPPPPPGGFKGNGDRPGMPPPPPPK